MSALIASASARPANIARLLDNYDKMTVADCMPEVDDMRVGEERRAQSLPLSRHEAVSFNLPYPVRGRLNTLVGAAEKSDAPLRASLNNVASATIIGATTDGITLERMIGAYKEITVGGFDPESPAAQITAES